LLDPRALAVDSVRFRADASTKAVRTKKRSLERLAELSRVDLVSLDEETRLEHLQKIERHRQVVALCEEQQRTNVVLTSPGAGLMKFPNGGSGPGHRATVVGCGVKERLIIDVLVDSDATDFGKLAPAVVRARQALTEAGVVLDKGMQIAGDAGYFSVEDLAFAAENRHWVDVLINEGQRGRRKSEDDEPLFGHDAFVRRDDGVMVCPAERTMLGPYADHGRERWNGRDCGTCGLRPKCTRGKQRALVIDREYQRLRDAMRERMALPGAEQRYNQRIATIEPVFSELENVMGFRRVSSRKASAVEAEILLKVFAYNLKRLVSAKRIRRNRMLAVLAIAVGLPN
jgi:hypothetical protein